MRWNRFWKKQKSKEKRRWERNRWFLWLCLRWNYLNLKRTHVFCIIRNPLQLSSLQCSKRCDLHHKSISLLVLPHYRIRHLSEVASKSFYHQPKFQRSTTCKLQTSNIIKFEKVAQHNTTVVVSENNFRRGVN